MCRHVAQALIAQQQQEESGAAADSTGPGSSLHFPPTDAPAPRTLHRSGGSIKPGSIGHGGGQATSGSYPTVSGSGSEKRHSVAGVPGSSVAAAAAAAIASVAGSGGSPGPSSTMGSTPQLPPLSGSVDAQGQAIQGGLYSPGPPSLPSSSQVQFDLGHVLRGPGSAHALSMQQDEGGVDSPRMPLWADPIVEGGSSVGDTTSLPSIQIGSKNTYSAPLGAAQAFAAMVQSHQGRVETTGGGGSSNSELSLQLEMLNSRARFKSSPGCAALHAREFQAFSLDGSVHGRAPMVEEAHPTGSGSPEVGSLQGQAPLSAHQLLTLSPATNPQQQGALGWGSHPEEEADAATGVWPNSQLAALPEPCTDRSARAVQRLLLGGHSGKQGAAGSNGTASSLMSQLDAASGAAAPAATSPGAAASGEEDVAAAAPRDPATLMQVRVAAGSKLATSLRQGQPFHRRSQSPLSRPISDEAAVGSAALLQQQQQQQHVAAGSRAISRPASPRPPRISDHQHPALMGPQHSHLHNPHQLGAAGSATAGAAGAGQPGSAQSSRPVSSGDAASSGGSQNLGEGYGLGARLKSFSRSLFEHLHLASLSGRASLSTARDALYATSSAAGYGAGSAGGGGPSRTNSNAASLSAAAWGPITQLSSASNDDSGGNASHPQLYREGSGLGSAGFGGGSESLGDRCSAGSRVQTLGSFPSGGLGPRGRPPQHPRRASMDWKRPSGLRVSAVGYEGPAAPNTSGTHSCVTSAPGNNAFGGVTAHIHPQAQLPEPAAIEPSPLAEG